MSREWSVVSGCLGEAGGEVCPGVGQPVAGGAPGGTQLDEGVTLGHHLLERAGCQHVHTVLDIEVTLGLHCLIDLYLEVEALLDEEVQAGGVSLSQVSDALHPVDPQPSPVEDEAGEACDVL